MSNEDLEKTPLRIAMVGLGVWAYKIVAEIKNSQKLSLMTAFTRTREKRESFCEKYNCQSASSFEEILEDPNIEALILTTPNSMHYQHTLLGVQKGKHIFVDKPISNTIEEAKEMIRICHSKGVVLAVGHNARRFVVFRKMKSLIRKGTIGIPVMAEGNYSHNLGLSLTPNAWRWHEKECPSGPLIQVGIHLIDTLHYLFGSVEWVSSVFSKILTSSQIPDVTSTILYFKNDLIGYVGSAYVVPFSFSLNVYGTEANLFSDYSKGLFLQGKNAKELQHIELEGIGTNARTDIGLFSRGPGPETIGEELDEFAKCVREGKKPEVSGEEALSALAVVHAAIRSAEEKRSVYLSEILSSQDKF